MRQQGTRSRNRILLFIVALAVLIPLVLATAAAVGFVWAASTVERLGEPTPEPVTRTVALPSRGPAGVAIEATDPPVRLDIDLEDGVFVIRPGPPGSDVRVDGTYATAYYNLSHEYEPAADGDGRTVRIRLHRSRSFLIQLVAHAMNRTSSTPNDLTVTIPRGVPLAVDLTVRAGESRIDLGGLSLTDLVVDLAMGDHRLEFSEPVGLAPRRLRLDGGMGEIRFERLGNARATDVEASGHMGSVTVDLGGAWTPDAVANITLNNLMGELRLRAPAELRLVGGTEETPIAEVEGLAGAGEGSGDAVAGGPVLRLRVSTTMGETRLTRY